MKFRNPFKGGANAFSPGTDRFPSIDALVLDARLKTERQGRKDGVNNIPPADACTYTTAEMQIVETVADLRKKGLEYYENQIAAYGSRIRAARAEREQIELRSGELRNEMRVEADSWKGHLWNAQQRVTGFQEKLDAFRERHGAVGPPRGAKNSVLMIGILAIMLMIEIALSGLFFAEKNEMGLLGGIGVAVVISGVNVITCLLMGFGARYVRLRGVFPTMFGVLMIALFFVEAIGLNLLVAHFRDALSTLPWTEATIEAIESVRADPFAIESLKSVVVFLFGFTVCTIAFIEGAVLWLDPRPGYNRLYDDTEKAIDEYGHLYREAQEELTKLFNASREELQGQAQKFRARVHSALDAVGGQSSITRQLNSFTETCDVAANRLLTSYREANQRARTADRPPYFDKVHTFPEYVRAADLSGIDSDEAKAEIAKIDKIVEEGVNDILKTRQDAVDAFISTETLVENARRGRSVASASPTAHTNAEPA